MSQYVQLTRRMCVELLSAFGGTYDASIYEWAKIQETLNNGISSRSGTRVDLNSFPLEATEHLLALFKVVEAGTFHKQSGDALRARIALLNDYLGVSAVDRLSELM